MNIRGEYAGRVSFGAKEWETRSKSTLDQIGLRFVTIINLAFILKEIESQRGVFSKE